jgi:hypothetical protein
MVSSPCWLAVQDRILAGILRNAGKKAGMAALKGCATISSLRDLRGCAEWDYDYSERSMVTGSIRTAWITAGNAASSAAARIVSEGSASTPTSVGFTW